MMIHHNLLIFLLVTIISYSNAFSATASVINALNSPPQLQKRDAFIPKITSPTTATVWNIGEMHNVTWDISQAPANITNQFGGRIQLRADGHTTFVVLADNFDILLGTYPITVPWVITSNKYQLVLFGDSGNFSPEFTINGATREASAHTGTQVAVA